MAQSTDTQPGQHWITVRGHHIQIDESGKILKGGNKLGLKRLEKPLSDRQKETLRKDKELKALYDNDTTRHAFTENGTSTMWGRHPTKFYDYLLEEDPELHAYVDETHSAVNRRLADPKRIQEQAHRAAEERYEAQGHAPDHDEAPAKLRGKKVWLYHGTSGKFHDDVMAEGLRIKRGVRSNPGTSGSNVSASPHIKLTSNPAQAHKYASYASNKHGGDPTVYRVLVDGDDLAWDTDDADIKSGREQYATSHVRPDQLMEVNGERIRPMEKGLPHDVSAEKRDHGKFTSGASVPGDAHQLTSDVRSWIADQGNATHKLLKPEYRRKVEAGAVPTTGHCYGASEAVWHATGGEKRSPWQAHVVRHEGGTHWFLKHKQSGEVLDPTHDQFASPVSYQSGKACGFLTRVPSQHAQAILRGVGRGDAIEAAKEHAATVPSKFAVAKAKRAETELAKGDAHDVSTEKRDADGRWTRDGSAPVKSRRNLLANAITADLHANGAVNLLGRSVPNADALAKLCQVFRNPSYETLRYVFVRRGKIVGMTGVSSRLPSHARVFPVGDKEGGGWLRSHMQNCDADGYYMLHNHPSGNPTPSRADLATTQYLAASVPGCKGHLVIDHTKYSVISKDGQDYETLALERDGSPDNLHVPSVPHPLLGKRIAEPADLAAIGLSLETSDNYAVLVGISATGHVRGLMEVSNDVLTHPVRGLAAVRAFSRQCGSASVSAVVPKSFVDEPELRGRGALLIRNGSLVDVVTPEGDSLFASGERPGYGMLHGKPEQKMQAREVDTVGHRAAEMAKGAPHDTSDEKRDKGGKFSAVEGRTGAATQADVDSWIHDQGAIHIPGGHDKRHDAHVRVMERKPGHVRVNYADYDAGGVWMPEASLKHFVNDLSGHVDGKADSGDKHVDAVLRGEGQYLGRGDDGLAFRVGDKVVKVSSTVPFQPMNEGHRSPEQARDRLLEQARNHNALHAAGIPGVAPVRTLVHGDKAFQIQQHYDTTTKLSRAQVEQVRDSVAAMHQAGWHVRDQVQVGVDKDGQIQHYDLGKAHRLPEEGQAAKWAREDDVDHVKMLMKDHGHEPLSMYSPWATKTQEDVDNMWTMTGENLSDDELRDMFQKHPDLEETELEDAKAARDAHAHVIMRDKRPYKELSEMQGRYFKFKKRIQAAAQYARENTMEKGADFAQDTFPATSGRKPTERAMRAAPSMFTLAQQALDILPMEAGARSPGQLMHEMALASRAMDKGTDGKQRFITLGEGEDRHVVPVGPDGKLQGDPPLSVMHKIHAGTTDAGKKAEWARKIAEHADTPKPVAEEKRPLERMREIVAERTEKPQPVRAGDAKEGDLYTTVPGGHEVKIGKRTKDGGVMVTRTKDKKEVRVAEGQMLAAKPAAEPQTQQPVESKEPSVAEREEERVAKPEPKPEPGSSLQDMSDQELIAAFHPARNAFGPGGPAAQSREAWADAEKHINALRAEGIQRDMNLERSKSPPRSPEQIKKEMAKLQVRLDRVNARGQDGSGEYKHLSRAQATTRAAQGGQLAAGLAPLRDELYRAEHPEEHIEGAYTAPIQGPNGQDLWQWAPRHLGSLSPEMAEKYPYEVVKAIARGEGGVQELIATTPGVLAALEKFKRRVGDTQAVREVEERIKAAMPKEPPVPERKEEVAAKPEPKPASRPAPEKTRAKLQALAKPEQEAESVLDERSGRRVHDDVGEKIGGARKDKWAEVHAGNIDALEAEGSGEAFKHVTKEKVLGRHDPANDRMLGSTPGASYVKRAIYAAIGARPSMPETTSNMRQVEPLVQRLFPGEKFTADSPLARSLYISGIDRIKKGLDACQTVADVERFLDDWKDEHKGKWQSEERVTAEMGADLEKRYPAEWSAGYSYVFADGQKYKVSDAALQRDGYRIGYRTENDKTVSVLRKDAEDLATRYRPIFESAVLGKRWHEGVLKSFKGAFGDTLREARRRETDDAHWATAYPEWAGGEAERATRERDPVQKYVVTRAGGVPERVGGTPIPSSVTGDALMDRFGLRAVEYGNWVNDADAGKHLHHAYGALTDLAGLLGADPKDVASNGKLALAFGARGSGHAMAHYEPDRRVINLTHTRGGGTLSHEWAHALDHALTEHGFTVEKRFTRRGTFASHGEAPKLHSDTQRAFQEAMKAIAAPSELSPQGREELERRKAEVQALYPKWDKERGHEVYKQDTARYNAAAKSFNSWSKEHLHDQKRSKFASDAAKMGDYWERPHEMFARAFESWAEDRLAQRGQKNTYLVTGTAQKYRWAKKDKDGMTWEDLEPYPHGEERKRIHGAIDKLVETLARTGDMKKGLERLAERSTAPSRRTFAEMLRRSHPQLSLR